MSGITLRGNMQHPIDWHRFAEIVRSASKILLTIHHRPDGDCIGSALAMRLILLSLGREVRIIAPHRVPPTLAFLDPHHIITALEDMTEEDVRYLQTADLFFVLDTSSWAQLGDMATPFRESSAKKIVLDHHVKGDDIGAETFIDSSAEATGALVVQAADALGVPISADIAMPAFVAIATDTGWFRFSNVTAETFHVAEKLVKSGAQPDAIYWELYEQESLGRIRLVGRTLSKAETYLDGQFLLTWILRNDLNAAGARDSDSEDIVNMLLQVRGSKMAVLLSELKDGSFKISLRSRCSVDCSVLAARFGGGGHKKAAGATLNFTLEQAKQKIIVAVSEALQEVQ
jgi:phosphoesterase RecJ-like protein